MEAKTLLGTDAPNPTKIIVRTYNPRNITPPPPSQFQAAWGIRPEPDVYANASGDGYYESVSSTIYLYKAPWTSHEELQYFLVHEYTHLVQANNDVSAALDNRLPATASPRLKTYITEGAAVYVGAVYGERQGFSYDTMERLESSYDQASPYRRWQLAPYYFGSAYVKQHVSDVESLETLYLNPPNTTEAIIHGERNTDPPSTIDVRSESNTDWVLRALQTRGELAIRLVLETGVNRSVAKRAATGWDGDTLATFEKGNQTGYVWLLKWDTTADAREFEHAALRYSNRTNVNGSVAVLGRSNRTVVLAAGPAPFVQNVSVSDTKNDAFTITFSNDTA